jgi:DNA-binding transcriptional LysR family regulator
MQWDDRIGRRVKLRDLHIFMAVAQHGSMGRAAKQLAVSQPVVSKAISDLENTLNVRLVDRTPKGVEPTPYGGALLRWGTILFDDLRRSVNEIEFLADPTAGEVRIGSIEASNASLVPAVIDRLTSKFPRLVFQVFQAPNYDALYKLVRERSADLVIVYSKDPIEDEDLVVEVLSSDSLSVMAGPESKWLQRRKIDPAEIVNEPWCMPMEGTLAASALARAFCEKGLAMPRHVVKTNSIQLQHAMAATSRFLTFACLTQLRLSGNRAGLRVVPVDLHIPYGSLSIVTLKDRTISPVAQLFIDCARELAQSLAET